MADGLKRLPWGPNILHYDVEDFNSVGYWGCVRDRNADTLHRTGLIIDKRRKAQELGDVHWGQFEDELHSAGLIMKDERKRDSSSDSESPRAVQSATTVSSSGNDRNYLYDFKSSKLKIQAIKRDE